MCWVDEENKVGFPLMQIEDNTEACRNGTEPDKCWYGIMKKDLDRIQHSLNH